MEKAGLVDIEIGPKVDTFGGAPRQSTSFRNLRRPHAGKALERVTTCRPFGTVSVWQ